MTNQQPSEGRGPPQHTHIVHDQDIARIEFVTRDDFGYPWYPVHAWLHRSGVYPLLSPGARALIDILLWQAWEQERAGGPPGQVNATIEQFAAWSGGSVRSAFRDVGFLLEPTPQVLAITGNPARLLAKLGPTVWQPMPGRDLIRRKGGDRTDTPVPPLAKVCQQASAQGATAARANSELRIQTNHPKTERYKTETERAQLRSLGGWPEPRQPGLFEAKAAAADPEPPSFTEGPIDVRTVLSRAGFRGELLGATCDLPRLTTQEAAACCAEVLFDKTVDTPVPVIAYRLFKARGLDVPALGRRSHLSKELQQDVASLARLVGNKRRQPGGSA